MYNVYVIKNGVGKIYIGQTSDLETRLERHNGLLLTKARSYTKINKGPWEIVHKEEYSAREEALKREKYLKSLKNRKALTEIMSSDGGPFV